MSQIHLARVYDHEAELSGQAFFVERLWPRGVRREDLRAVWLKDAAPSPDLRRWCALVLRDHVRAHLPPERTPSSP